MFSCRPHKDHPYLVGVAFTGWAAASYLNYICTQLYSFRMAAILKMYGQHSPSSASAFILTIFQTVTCIALLDFSFVRKSERIKPNDESNAVRKSERIKPDVESNAVVVQGVTKFKTSDGNNGEGLSKSPSTTTTAAVPASASSISVTTTSTTLKEIITIIVISHVSGSFLTNMVISLSRNDFVIVLKFLEPVITALFYKLVHDGSLRNFAFLALPLISGSAFVFGQGLSHVTRSRGHFLAFIATVLFSARNLAFKGIQNTHGTVRLRNLKQSLLILFVSFVLIFGLCLTNTFWGAPCLYAVLSSLFHVTNSYISICVILNNMSVISHAVANLWKRLLVVALLGVSKSKRLSPTSGSALVLGFLGVLVFLKGGRIKPAEERSVKGKLLFDAGCLNLCPSRW